MAGETAPKEVVQDEQTDEQAAASLAAGFEQGGNPPAADAAAEEAPAATTEEGRQAVDVEYVQVTKQDFDRIMAALPKAEAIDGEIRKVFGTIGNVKQELINRVQGLAPSGMEIEISDEDFAELAADFPELAGHTKTAVERIFKKAKVRGTGQAPAPTELIQEKIEEAVRNARIKEGLDVLNEIHPGWTEIVGAFGDDNDFRRWLKSQPQAYQDRINNTDSPLIVKQALDAYQSVKAPTSPVAQRPQPSRPDRRAAAVQPKGSSAPPPGPQRNTETDDLHAGFYGR